MDVAQLSGVIGGNVQRLRATRGFSQDGLAEAAGLSKGTVVAIEQHRGNPSVATLCALSEALGVGLATLLEPPAGPLLKRRGAGEAVELWRTDAGSHASLQLGTDAPSAVELWRWTIVPGDAFDGGAHPRGTVETLLVDGGRLRVEVGGRAVDVGLGDAVAFEAHEPHRYECLGDQPVGFTMWIAVGDAGPMPPPSTVGDA